MKRLTPHDVIKNKSYVGHKPRDIMAMAEHYGFHRTNGGGKHLLFTHADYQDLTFTLQEGNADVGWQYVESAVKACLEVKCRNALRKEPVFEEIPAWAWKALPEGSFIEKPDHSVIYEMDDANERRYILRLEGKKLSIRSFDYPEDEFGTSFTVCDGSVNIAGLKIVFDALDADVRGHMDTLTQGFNDRLERLAKNRGFEMRFTPHEGEHGRTVHLHHPLYHLEATIDQPPDGKAISNQTVAQLQKLLDEHDACVYAQMEFLEELNASGWDIQQVSSQGRVGEVTFRNPQGARFTVPTYGELEMFDMQKVRELVAASVCPSIHVVEQITHLGADKPAKLPAVDNIRCNAMNLSPEEKREALRAGLRPREERPRS